MLSSRRDLSDRNEEQGRAQHQLGSDSVKDGLLQLME